MARITNEILSKKVDQLNLILNRPASMFKDTDGYIKNSANIGHLSLHSYKPGNKRIYRVEEITNTKGGVQDFFGYFHIPAKDLNFLIDGALKVAALNVMQSTVDMLSKAM